MKNRKFLLVTILLIVFSIIISGCSSSKNAKYETTQDVAPQTAPSDMGNSADYDFGGAEKDMIAEEKGYDMTEPDKIITTLSISMQTKEFMDTTDKLINIVGKYKGYVENSDISYNNFVYSTRLKYSNYTIRIPRENLENFTNELKEIGNIISQNTSKIDITKQYRDTESRLKVLEVKEERILALMEKAEKMEDIIVLENQLSDIIYEKENLTANIMDMDDKVDYSTAHIQIEEVAKLTSEETIKTTFWTKVANAIKDSTYFFSYNIQNLIIGFIYFIPYGLIIGVILYVIYRFTRKRQDKFPRE
ncbi:DUF4349 domain-containing protein [Tissierella sp.]|uniref:DUF4349 domain-containing protein n=1 Tax=Tissierella sp. TaxID=41274 RepID=UPI00285FDAD4|nr:DUF4349 domain-containing protein [Tissierella sp.]MDR7857476.1 DUF4349 domain-containing protein [Tissierella sp.]